MGDSPGSGPIANQTMAEMLQDYTKYLPGLLTATSAKTPEIATNQLTATQATQPAYNQLNLEQARQYAVPLAEVGQAVTDSNAQAGAKTNLNQITGTGGEVAKAAERLARETNPNYYNVQDKASEQAVNLLNAIDLKGLSPGEQMAVERGLNQTNGSTGNLGNSNATNTLRNAMMFGDAYDKKLSQLSNAINTGNQTAASAQNTGFNSTNLALGQPNTSTASNFGTGTFTNTSPTTQTGSTGTAFNFGSGLLNAQTSTNNAAQAANASISNANSIPAYLGATVCCFIFLEMYHGKLPWFIRKSRDRYYNRNYFMCVGYRRVASWLVSLMQESPLIREIVWQVMVKPITEHLAHVNGVIEKRPMRKTITHFWLRAWSILGKGHTEVEYAEPMTYKEVV